MTGAEALAYLDKDRGKRFVVSFGRYFTMWGNGRIAEFIPGGEKTFNTWKAIKLSVGEFMQLIFRPCTDPSIPDGNEFEKDRKNLINHLDSATWKYSERPGDMTDMIFDLIEKYYVRKL